MERFLIDLDGTLLFGSFEKENEFFHEVLKEQADDFLANLLPLLEVYENTFSRYQVDWLSQFLTKNSNVTITKDMIYGWIETNSTMKDIVEEEAFETLDYLKCRNKSLAVLTNWFEYGQRRRLANSGLLPYFDDIYCGDLFLKPNPMSYMNAMKNYRIDETVMIGDNINKDFLGPRKIGMHSILYDPKGIMSPSNDVVKSLKKISEMY